MLKLKKFAVAMGILAATGIAAPPALADTIVVTPTPTITGAGPYTWTYSVDLVGFASINAGDFFTIFDFAGFIPGTDFQGSGDWLFSSALVGSCAVPELAILAACVAFDDPTIPNLTWTYTGPGVANPNTTPATVTSLGNFGADSLFNLAVNDGVVSRDNDLQTNTPNEGAFAQTNVPIASEIPEPTTLALLGIALVGLGFLRRPQA